MRLALEKLDFWNDLFDRKKVKYAMNLPLEAHIIAKAKKKIHSKRTILGKFNNTRDWSSDLYYQPDDIKELFKKSKIKKVKKVNLEAPLDTHLINKKRLIDNFGFFNTLYKSSYFLLQHLYGRIKGNTKSKSIYIIPNFLGIWRNRKEFFKLKNTLALILIKLEALSMFIFLC